MYLIKIYLMLVRDFLTAHFLSYFMDTTCYRVEDEKNETFAHKLNLGKC